MMLKKQKKLRMKDRSLNTDLPNMTTTELSQNLSNIEDQKEFKKPPMPPKVNEEQVMLSRREKKGFNNLRKAILRNKAILHRQTLEMPPIKSRSEFIEPFNTEKSNTPTAKYLSSQSKAGRSPAKLFIVAPIQQYNSFTNSKEMLSEVQSKPLSATYDSNDARSLSIFKIMVGSPFHSKCPSCHCSVTKGILIFVNLLQSRPI